MNLDITFGHVINALRHTVVQFEHKKPSFRAQIWQLAGLLCCDESLIISSLLKPSKRPTGLLFSYDNSISDICSPIDFVFLYWKEAMRYHQQDGNFKESYIPHIIYELIRLSEKAIDDLISSIVALLPVIDEPIHTIWDCIGRLCIMWKKYGYENGKLLFEKEIAVILKPPTKAVAKSSSKRRSHSCVYFEADDYLYMLKQLLKDIKRNPSANVEETSLPLSSSPSKKYYPQFIKYFIPSELKRYFAQLRSLVIQAMSNWFSCQFIIRKYILKLFQQKRDFEAIVRKKKRKLKKSHKKKQQRSVSRRSKAVIDVPNPPELDQKYILKLFQQKRDFEAIVRKKKRKLKKSHKKKQQRSVSRRSKAVIDVPNPPELDQCCEELDILSERMKRAGSMSLMKDCESEWSNILQERLRRIRERRSASHQKSGERKSEGSPDKERDGATSSSQSSSEYDDYEEFEPLEDDIILEFGKEVLSSVGSDKYGDGTSKRRHSSTSSSFSSSSFNSTSVGGSKRHSSSSQGKDDYAQELCNPCIIDGIQAGGLVQEVDRDILHQDIVIDERPEVLELLKEEMKKEKMVPDEDIHVTQGDVEFEGEKTIFAENYIKERRITSAHFTTSSGKKEPQTPISSDCFTIKARKQKQSIPHSSSSSSSPSSSASSPSSSALKEPTDEPAPAMYMKCVQRRLFQPRFFSSVISGYVWNQYSRTHYDSAHPPPRIVKGYTLTVLYPNLLPSKENIPIVQREDKHGLSQDGTELIRITTRDPQYSDLIFSIVKSPWDRKRSRSVFERKVLRVRIMFKMPGYKR
ncbi:hypothetical protein ADUPG1_006969 [Aduncisulcus paluster]|uniref:Splicing factor Cactin C-terminal domain-containing protein n=1 Tax=Aduncisulcus paluster TaxID=2918883 RepID=A0ABQ5KK79_9EUKA|nr:hypothetical protein ADUPG1_006969 [Aduncisulcus paluster]